MGRGMFFRDDPLVLSDPEADWTLCWDASARTLKFFDGAAWRSTCVTQYLLVVSDGTNLIGVDAGSAGQHLIATGAGSYPSWQTCSGYDITADQSNVGSLSLAANKNLVMSTCGNMVPAAVSGTPTEHGLYRENVPKAWVSFDGSAGTVIADNHFNVASITDNATGDYTVTWDRDFTCAFYAMVGTCQEQDAGVGTAVNVVAGAQAVG